MLSVYFPTSWDDDSEIETMYELLQLILNNIHCSGARIVIGGDFNANVGSLQWSDEQDVVGEWGSGLRNARGATLISWILMNQQCGRQLDLPKDHGWNQGAVGLYSD